MKFSVFQVSCKGGRLNNEDRMGYCYTRESGLFALADGMGGHPEGEVAAQLALQTVVTLYQRQAKPQIADVRNFLIASLLAAHTKIIKYAGNKAVLDMPRTTFVAVVTQGTTATWIHSGDSRLYVIRNGQLLMRTRDHSNVERPPSGGSPTGVNRNLLQTCLGSPVAPLFDVSPTLQLLQGDRIMLCSDGLWDMLDEAQIVCALSTRPVAKAVPDLAEMALRRGGAYSDNVTLIALEWETPNMPDVPERPVSSSSVFASTIQTGFSDTGIGIDDFDDTAIKRPMAEINEATRRPVERRR